MTTDPYETLGVERHASAEEIKREYRRLARQYHPDTNSGDPGAEARFKEVSVAYEILSDPEKRRRFDTFGDLGAPGGTGAGVFDLGDLFEAFFGGPMGGSRRQAGPPRAGDAEARLELSLEEAAFGATRVLDVRLPVECDRCTGSGCEPGTHPARCEVCGGRGEVRQVRRTILGQMVTAGPCQTCAATGQVIPTPCAQCRGQGRVVADRRLDVEVPAGIDEGQRLRLSGRGPAAPRGGVPGDLYVTVHVLPHGRLERAGNDLLAVLRVPMTQAALGATVTIETLDGPEELVLPAGTQPGRVFTLRGRGVVKLRGRGRGDLLVRVDVVVPERLEAEEADLLRRLAELRGDDVATREAGFFSRIKSAFQ